jgi:thioredoxin-like negative regulator of GroEL
VRVPVDERPDLAEEFGVEEVPTICVVELELDPWLR